MALPHAPRRVRALAATLLTLAAALAPTAFALDAGEVLDALEASAASIQDLSFTLEGELVDEAGQTFQLEVEVLAIPDVPAAGFYIVRPDAIADNQIVLLGDEVRSYTFLTNQVSIFDVSDPDAFGGLIEVGPDGELPVSLDLAAVFAGWDASVVEEGETDGRPTVTLRFANRDAEATMQTVLATVTADTWDPLRLTFLRAGDVMFADLRFVDWVRDQGLDVAEVTYLPEDAEVLDRRR